MMKIEISERLKRLPPYLFVEIDRAKKKARDEAMAKAVPFMRAVGCAS